jgi:hypothetical protein
VGTRVTANGVSQLKDLSKLKHLYLYQTGVSSGDWPLLRQAFPQVELDSGGYRVPTFAADTTVVKFN